MNNSKKNNDWYEEIVDINDFDDSVGESQIEANVYRDLAELEQETGEDGEFYSEDIKKIYLHDLGGYPVLSYEETTALLTEYAKTKDKEVFEKIVNHNLRLVYGVACCYTNRGVDLMDLIQVGSIGLMTAVKKFDVSLGTKLSTYAVYWIKNTIIREINKSGRLIHIPETEEQFLFKIKKYKRLYEDAHGVEPTVENIADYLDTDVERVKLLLNADQLPASLDDTSNDEEGKTNKIRTVYADDTCDPVKEAEINDINRLIEKCLTLLSEDEAYVFYHTFTLKQEDRMSMAQIAAKKHWKHSKVRALKAKAVKKVRSSSLGACLADALCFDI